MRFFNTSGPVNCAEHYCLPPLARIDLDEVLNLIAQKKYFLLHAPRQTGKTSFLLALTDYLNAQGTYRAVYANIEGAQAAREDVAMGITAVVDSIGRAANDLLRDSAALTLARQVIADAPALGAVDDFLTQWCQTDARPTVLLLDEVDALVGDTLISLLRQLRAGYTRRPRQFPHAILLCSVRDLQDYRIHSAADKAVITGGSAFNIKAKSLRMGDFTRVETVQLLGEHTAETGQVFTPDALETVWSLTQGQPGLVNALAYEACFEIAAGRNRAQTISRTLIEQAKENLILSRATHLHQLADKLREARVRRIIEPILAGESFTQVSEDDRDYVIDLGLVRRDGSGGLIVANPIYREIIPRTLAGAPQDSLPRIAPIWLAPDGSLNADKLLQAFLAFWRQHGEPLLKSAPYHEVAPQLVLMAFLHRVVNGLGMLDREYALGSGRMDLCLRYGPTDRPFILGIELKVWRDGKRDPLTAGLDQLDHYLQRIDANAGWLVIFDRRANLPPIEERTSAQPAVTPSGRTVTIIRA